MVHKIIYIAVFLSLPSLGFSQTGGDNVYEFLNLTHSGLVASLGGSNVSLGTSDLNMAYHNPSLLGSEMNGSLALNYVNYLAGINYGMTMYSRRINNFGNYAAGISYLNYGTFSEADESGNITGSFTAAEYAMLLIYSRNIDSAFTAGITLKPVLSHLERYTSFGLAADIGASWHSRDNLLSAGIVFKNIGLQITTYTGEEREKLPFEIMAGASYRLEHAPFRFSLTLRHLEKFDLTHFYDDPSTSQDSEPPGENGFGENLLRHMIIGTEIIPHKNFYLSAGYNYQRHSELKVEGGGSLTGFSWGFGINTSIVNISFGRATYHLAGASNHITVIVRPELMYRKFKN